MFNVYPPAAHDVYNQVKFEYDPSIDVACQAVYKACKGLGTDEDTLIKEIGGRSPNDRNLLAYRYKEIHEQSLKEVVASETSGDFGFLLELLSVPTPEAECHILYKACKGLGTTENLIWPIIMGRTNTELSILKKTFFDTYNTDLNVWINSELGGDFKKVIMAALQGQMVDYNPEFHTRSKAEEDADKLYKAGEGKWGTDEESFIKVLLTSPPQHLKVINEMYAHKHQHTLQRAIEKEFGGDSKRALLFYANIMLSPVEYLAEFIEGTMKGMGTDETSLSAAIARYHFLLDGIKSEYTQKYGKSLRDRIQGETSGDFRSLLMAMYDAPTSNPASA